MTIIKGWAGFVDGKLNLFWPHHKDWPDRKGPLAIYKSKKEARKAYEDVRRVEIKVVE